MKYANLIIGLVLFSVFLTVILDFGIKMGNSLDTDTTELIGIMGNYSHIPDTERTALKGSDDATDAGQQQSDESNFFITGALKGTKLLWASFTVLTGVVNSIEQQIGLNPIFTQAAYAILVIIIGLSILFMFMRFKAET
jgi:hypothetical protein